MRIFAGLLFSLLCACSYAQPRHSNGDESPSVKAYKLQAQRCQDISIIIITAVSARESRQSPQQALDAANIRNITLISAQEKKKYINFVYFSPGMSGYNSANIMPATDALTRECINEINAPKYRPLE